MQIHDLDNGRVITLDGSEDPALNEQFVFVPPGDATPDTSWYTTRAETVTVFAPQDNQAGYYTVAGEQLHAPASVVGDDRFWELDMQFTDSGPLPPHVRRNVEDIVPVVDRPGHVLGGDEPEMYWNGVEGKMVKGPSPSTSDRRSQRRADFELLDGTSQDDLLSVHRPSNPDRLRSGLESVAGYGPSKVLDLSPGPEQRPFNSIPVGVPIYDRGGR